MTSLNTEQLAALQAVKKGRNIFLTGAGGTGKSHTIRAITEWASSAGIRCAVTAMTGCAALLLNYEGAAVRAKTLHSWAGVGLARETPAELSEIVDRNRRAKRRWIDTKLLIVDEVSMMTPDFLEKLDLISRKIRRHPSKFGGLQIVFAGDFCQLPPVARSASSGNPVQKEGNDMQFVFQGPSWAELIDETHNLVQIVRQSDPVFQRLLTEARMGALSPESLSVLESRMGLDWGENEIRPTLLFSRNSEVDKINRINMEALVAEGRERRFYEPKTVVMEKNSALASPGPRLQARFTSITDPDVQRGLAKLDTDAPYDSKLELCIGAQVMLLTNLDQEGGLVNGSRGVVTGYTGGGLPLVRFLGFQEPVIIDRANWWLAEPDNIGRSQIPLKVAYALTIHKSQGSTLDSALVDIGSNTFEFGQAYVALSRCRSLEGLHVWKLDPRKIVCHPAVRAFYEALQLMIPEEEIEAVVEGESWTAQVMENLPSTWAPIVEPRIDRIATNIAPLGLCEAVEPPAADVFAALRACPDPAAIRVIILGQDPYPTAGNAHGLSFSVRPGVKPPASLQNIFKELASDLQVPMPSSGNLSAWADQGILLLNDVLTVTAGKPQSHSKQGWEELTIEIITKVLQAAPHVVFVAWGRFAQKKLEHPSIKPLLHKHTVLTAPHPSPLSAHTGFFGSKPFSQANAALTAHGQHEIRWVQ